MDADRVFVDTNILVYSTRPSSCFHARATGALGKAVAAEPRLAISRQILREYLAVVTRPGGDSEPLAMADALADIARFADLFEILEDGPAVGAELIQLCRTVVVPDARCTTPTSWRRCSLMAKRAS